MDLWKIMQAISAIIQSARRLYEVPRPEPSDMNNKIKQLESTCNEQSKLLEQTAENISELARELQGLTGRVKTVFWISVVPLILGMLLIVQALFIKV